MNSLQHTLLTAAAGISIATTPAYAPLQQSIQKDTNRIISEHDDNTRKKKSHILLAETNPKKKDLSVTTLPVIEVTAEAITLLPFQEKIIENFTQNTGKLSANTLSDISFHHKWLGEYIQKEFSDPQYTQSVEVQREILFHETMHKLALQSLKRRLERKK